MDFIERYRCRRDNWRGIPGTTVFSFTTYKIDDINAFEVCEYNYICPWCGVNREYIIIVCINLEEDYRNIIYQGYTGR